MGKKRIIVRSLIVVCFLFSWYFVEAGFCGSSVVAEYNDGFGTVDMISYDVSVVRSAMEPLGEEGMTVYKQYYVMDFLFVIFFGAFQLMFSDIAFSWRKKKWISVIIFGVPVLRGVCDIVENVILLRTLCTFPKISETAIFVCAGFTSAKLFLIRCWVVLLAAGFIWKIILCRKASDIIKNGKITSSDRKNL